MTTALDIITDAAKLIGAVFKSEALSADEANDGLIALNDLLDSWSNDDLVVYAETPESFTLTGAASYTIGASGTFNTTRPITINSAVVRSGSVDYPLEVLTPEQYERIPVKSVTSIPEYLVYDNAFPLGTITFYPRDINGTLRLLTNKPLTNISLLTTTISLPPGWKRALKTNLAIELAPGYGVEPSASVIRNAARSLGAIKRAVSANKPKPFMPPLSQPYNILTGTE